MYSFFVSHINEPCCGADTPSISTGALKFRKYWSALQIR